MGLGPCGIIGDLYQLFGDVCRLAVDLHKLYGYLRFGYICGVVRDLYKFVGELCGVIVDLHKLVGTTVVWL